MQLPDDETLDAALADPGFRQALGAALTHAGVTTPIDDIPREQLREYVGHAIAGMQAANANGDGPEGADASASGDPQADAVPDQLLDEALADPEMRATIEAVLKDNGIDEPIEQLPRQLLKRLIYQMMEYARAAQEDGGGGSSTV